LSAAARSQGVPSKAGLTGDIRKVNQSFSLFPKERKEGIKMNYHALNLFWMIELTLGAESAIVGHSLLVIFAEGPMMIRTIVLIAFLRLLMLLRRGH